MTGVVDGLTEEHGVDARTLTVGLVAVLVGFGAWWTYFDYAGHRPPVATRAAAVRWLFAHLPLTAAIAAMGAAMVSLVEHAHDTRTPAATAWLLSATCATVLAITMVVATTLRAWREDRALYRPLALTSAAAAAVSLALGAARPAPCHSDWGCSFCWASPGAWPSPGAPARSGAPPRRARTDGSSARTAIRPAALSNAEAW